MQIIKLSEPAVFPPQFETASTDFLAAYWYDRQWEMEQEFGIADLPPLRGDELRHTMIADKLSMIARAAAGDIDRANDDLAGEVYECCQSLVEHLFAAPGMTAAYDIPAAFWSTPIGEMVALTFIWLERDELITLTEASRISGKSISTLSSQITRGKLRSFRDPRAANPQKAARLVRRADVEEMAGRDA